MTAATYSLGTPELLTASRAQTLHPTRDGTWAEAIEVFNEPSPPVKPNGVLCGLRWRGRSPSRSEGSEEVELPPRHTLPCSKLHIGSSANEDSPRDGLGRILSVSSCLEDVHLDSDGENGGKAGLGGAVDRVTVKLRTQLRLAAELRKELLAAPPPALSRQTTRESATPPQLQYLDDDDPSSRSSLLSEGSQDGPLTSPGARLTLGKVVDMAGDLFRGARDPEGPARATFTVSVYLEKRLRLGAGVKELPGGEVVVKALHQTQTLSPGPAEKAGLRLGDQVIGVNYTFIIGGIEQVVSLLCLALRDSRLVRLQVSRDLLRLGAEPPPVPDCPRITKLLGELATLHASGILSDSERWRLGEGALTHMAWDEGALSGAEVSGPRDLHAMVCRRRTMCSPARPTSSMAQSTA